MAMKPASYPFMNIAKKYNYAYGDVVSIVEIIRNSGNVPKKWRVRAIAFMEICRAIDEQELIRRGVIDWLTGEDTRLT